MLLINQSTISSWFHTKCRGIFLQYIYMNISDFECAYFVAAQDILANSRPGPNSVNIFSLVTLGTHPWQSQHCGAVVSYNNISFLKYLDVPTFLSFFFTSLYEGRPVSSHGNIMVNIFEWVGKIRGEGS